MNKENPEYYVYQWPRQNKSPIRRLFFKSIPMLHFLGHIWLDGREIDWPTGTRVAMSNVDATETYAGVDAEYYLNG